jgi:UDP-N-acetylmuramate--alanine ligase
MQPNKAKSKTTLRGKDDSLANRVIHLVGAGGSGMSGLAMMMHGLGALVSGSDAQQGPEIEALLNANLTITTGESAGELSEECDLVIHSAAVPPDHPELLEAQRRDIEVLSYAEALGRLQSERTGISIAGTHGKSTTSAMLAHTLIQAGLEPNVIVGAQCPQIGGGWRVGDHRIPGEGPLAGREGLMICEACEFNRSFHHHRPVLALINNIEEDHLDIYGGLEEIVEAFHAFAQLIPHADQGGYLLIAHEGAHRRDVTAGLDCCVETFGFTPESDWRITLEEGQVTVHDRDGEVVAGWHSPMIGTHNAMNAAAAAILAHRSGANWEVISKAIASFSGLDRRMQLLGRRSLPDGGQMVVIDDYGHHPTEVEATLRALRTNHAPKRLICVFQPHQHSRTRFLLDHFATSFDHADIVIVPQIYFVRDSEAERQRVSASDLVERLRNRGTRAMHVHPFEAIVEQLEVIGRDGDLVVVMGAGPVWQIGHQLLGLDQT